MERLSSEHPVVPLSAFLTTPQPAAPAATVPATEPDPLELLAQERLRVLDAARQEGYKQGTAEADDAIRKAVLQAEEQVLRANADESERLSAANQRVTQLLRSLQAALVDNDDRIEALATEVAFSALVRVLGIAATDRKLLADLCRQALGEFRQRPVVLRVATDEAAAVQQLAAEDDVRVVSDPQLIAGQCRLETHKGVYDTSIEARLEAIKQAFLNALAAGGPQA